MLLRTQVAPFCSATLVSSYSALDKSNEEERLRLVQESFVKSNLKLTTVMPKGHSPARELVRIAREHKVDLIVAGTESKTGMERLFLGSTAEQLIRTAPCPVLMIARNAVAAGDGPLAFNRILYATDDSPEAAKAAVFALAFAEDSGAKLTCCYVEHVASEDAETRTFVREQFQSALKRLIPADSYDWCTSEYSVEHGDTDVSLLALAARPGADLIKLGVSKASFWLTRINMGLTPSLLAITTCPILTICPSV
jgi:nucleotide-binding universal stress UspA family protein